jgi:quercetin dioxygenase-like cupin family protein
MNEVLFTYIEQAISMAEYEPDRVKPISVLKSTGANVVVFAFAAESHLPEHESKQPILLQALEGTLSITVNGQTITLTPGDLLHIEPAVRHSVIAHEPAKLQLTVLMIDSPGPSTIPLSEA